ncbi:hypothetical protein ABZT51_45695 [Streptomyces sp. NPDC005373]|uniref:hypothetical protein n=1 Tax=Streptomyces sp. NPDC005373 TaxID=3156879 RepID=UPI0033ACC29C
MDEHPGGDEGRRLTDDCAQSAGAASANSFAVIEQEEGACPFGRVIRHHGVEAIAVYAARS